MRTTGSCGWRCRAKTPASLSWRSMLISACRCLPPRTWRRNNGMLTVDDLKIDLDVREARIRERVYADADFWSGIPEIAEALIATYFLHVRHGSLLDGVKTIPYHMTSGVKHPPEKTLL